MDIFRQAAGQLAGKFSHSRVPQQMQIVNEKIARPVAAQLIAEGLRQEPSPRRILRASVVFQKRKACVGKCPAHATPEYRQIL